MDGRSTLTPSSAEPTTDPTSRALAARCPRCRSAWDSIVPVRSTILGDVEVRRCPDCGGRATLGAEARPILTCGCGVPFVAAAGDPAVAGREPRCAECVDGPPTAGLDAADVVLATEHEVRVALEEEWSFIGSPALHGYLDGVAAAVARLVPGAPESPTVLVLDEWSVRSLALPSGAVIVSLGFLGAMEDEAELAFALAHDLFHAASGDAAGRLVRLGMRSLAAEGGTGGRQTWVRAAVELSRLGHGDERERAADDAAVAALLALRYDPAAAIALLRRLGSRAVGGDWHVGEWAFAHPPVAERIARIEARGAGVSFDLPRVNREPFRRAAGASVLSGGLARADGPATRLAGTDGGDERTPGRGRRVALWLALAALAVATAATAVLLAT